VISTALVTGGGIGGMTAAIALARAGIKVDLIDVDPQWRVYGAGISITGMSLRAFDALGVLGEIRLRGHVGSGMRGRTLSGEIVMDAPVPVDPAPVQQSGGILRPVLHEILSSAVRNEGIDVHLGVTVSALAQDAAGVDVTYSDGHQGRYDLVIGADGICSTIRSMVFPGAQGPMFTGQGCWRVVARRPAHVDRVEMYFGGPVKLGINPVSQDEMYMFILEHVPDNPRFKDDELVSHIRDLMQPYGGDVPAVRDSITRPSQVIYRPLEWLLLPDPWYQGRVVLIGDAAHATTPHLASGAGLAAEDGLVLAEELQRHDGIGPALRAFMNRRFERARLVVETSVRIGQMEMAHESPELANRLIGATFVQMQAPY
jgi:2-polyprenyl-6-methoxyphenol hydroxylase-like FAD-dependent oxidoreductase